MELGPIASTEVDAGPPSDFTERMVDGFFRRWVLYLLPVVLFVAIGVLAAGNITADYASSVRMSATSNPYLAQPTIRGTEIGFYESPGDGTARLINEQLGTDSFVDQIASRAGLSDAIDTGAITRADVRNRLSAFGTGQNTLQVSARWADPETAFLLVDATAKGYVDYLARIATADSLEAVDFWTRQLEDASEQVQSAEDALNQYLAQLQALPEGEDLPIAQQLAIQRLNSVVDAAIADRRGTQATLDEAQVTANQAALTSTRELTVIDPPEAATAPESVRRDKITAIVVSGLLGLFVALAALVLSTAADRAVRSRAQLVHAAGISSVVVVPRIKRRRRAKPTSTTRSDAAA